MVCEPGGHHALRDRYLPLTLLRRAEIHERLGKGEEAAALYRRFVELWAECDPELRPRVEEARRRIEALVGGTSSG